MVGFDSEVLIWLPCERASSIHLVPSRLSLPPSSKEHSLRLQIASGR